MGGRQLRELINEKPFLVHLFLLFPSKLMKNVFRIISSQATTLELSNQILKFCVSYCVFKCYLWFGIIFNIYLSPFWVNSYRG